MAKTTVEIPNMISGVSQQVPDLRLPSQMEAQLNGLPSIKNGFGRRYPLETIAKLQGTVPAPAQWHVIDRGDTISEDVWSLEWSTEWGDTKETAQYDIAFGDGTIYATNLLGREENVSVGTGVVDYLATPDPQNDLEFVSVKDFTFVLNRSKVTAMKGEASRDISRPYEALVFVSEARVSSKYHIYINDVQEATYTSGTTTATVDIAIDLEGDLQANLDLTKFTVVRNGSTLYIGSLDGNDFNIRTEEGDGGNTLKVFKDSTTRFNELPDLAIDTFRIKIENDPDFEEDDFWVEYEADSVTDQGKWKESRQDGLINEIDETTMPHQLIYNTTDAWSADWSDEWGSDPFSLVPVAWNERLVGDDTSVPYPSFIGNTINDIYYMRNRLGFLSGENIIQSEDSEHTNFWRTTLQAILDTDPIDVGTSHTKSSVFRHAVPTQERLLLFSDNTQFIYGSGDNILSPKTAFVNPSSEVSIEPNVRPFVTGGSVFFAVKKKVGTSIKEVKTDSIDDVVSPEDITSHVPTYIPKNVRHISGSNVDNMLFLSTAENGAELYVYKFLDQGEERVLSSWHKWTIDGPSPSIVGHHVIRDSLYLTVSYVETGGTKYYLYKINLSDDFVNTDLSYPIFLDRLVTTKGIYNSVTDLTTWTLPYEDADTLTVVKSSDWGNPGSRFNTLNITRPTNSTIAYPGDQSANLVHIGKIYETSSTLTQPMLKKQGERGPEVDNSAVYTVSNLCVDYFDSTSFDVELTYKDTTVRNHKYSGYLSNDNSFTIDSFNFNTGSWHVPVRTKGRRNITAKIKSDGYTQFNPFAARWIMNITRKKGRF